MEEWQDPDSGYLNCIGVGDTYVRKQMERILGSGDFNAPVITRRFMCAMGEEEVKGYNQTQRFSLYDSDDW